MKIILQFMLIGSFAMWVMNAQAGIILVDDYAEEIVTLPVTSLDEGDYESDNPLTGTPLIRVIHEKQNYILTSNINYDDVAGGGAGTILSGTVVNSYLVHFDQFGTFDIGDPNFTGLLPGEIFFDSDILGIIFTTSGLNATDSELGLPSVTSYATLSDRGLEFSGVNLPDSYSFSNGGTLQTDYINFELATTTYIDEIRVITAATTPVPVPAAVWLFGSALLGLAGISKRKKA